MGIYLYTCTVYKTNWPGWAPQKYTVLVGLEKDSMLMNAWNVHVVSV